MKKSPVRLIKNRNNLLLAAIIIINGYSLLLPLWPSLQLWIKKHLTSQQQKLTNSASTYKAGPSSEPIPSENRIVIPDLLLNEPVLEGKSVYTVDKGIWHPPYASSPDKGGNTVLIGHRFTYRGAAVFYHLDLMKAGQRFTVFWQGKKYVYQVKSTTAVNPHDNSVEAATQEPIMTLYTCTPLWSVKQRLVIKAERIEL